MHVTLGTASNKLYEYAAVGLPVLYLNEPHFNRYLQQYNWAFPVELTTASIRAAITAITEKYEYYSASAHESFRQGLNFEAFFGPVKQYLENNGYCR
jgi:hypothetical protein